MDYEKSFKNRSKSYLYAMDKFPDVLNDEFITAIEMLELKKNDVFLNIPAGGIPLQRYINPLLNINYIEYDTHKGFENENVQYCQWQNIPLESNSVDKILCLASFHHLNTNERIDTYKEFYRILKNNGKLVIADVIKNSQQDFWLNNFVNKYNSNGHTGVFFDENDSTLITCQKFKVNTMIKNYNWTFKKDNDIYIFFKHLFGLDLIDINDKSNMDIFKNAVNGILQYNCRKIPWKLIYFICSPDHKDP